MSSGVSTEVPPASSAIRIAFVSDAVYPFNKGGKERRLHEIARRLVATGAQVDIFTMKWWDGPDTMRLDGISLHAIAPLMSMYSNGRRSIREAVVFGAACLRLLGREFDVIDVDHMPFFPLFATRLVATLRRRRLVATWHEVWGRDYWLTYLGRAGHLAWLIEKWAVRMPHEIISVSEHTSRALTGKLAPTQPVHTIPLGVDIERLAAVPATAPPVDVLYTGRLLTHKRLDSLIRALAEVNRTRPGVRARVVGEGPERARLEALADEVGIAAQVDFRDFVSDDEVFQLMKAAKVFVLPSVREGFGLVVLEANACDTPVITVEHPGNAAAGLIDEGRTGLLCDADDESLAKAIVTVLDDPGRFQPAATLRARVPGVDWDAVTARVADVLDTAAGRAPLEAAGVRS